LGKRTISERRLAEQRAHLASMTEVSKRIKRIQRIEAYWRNGNVHNRRRLFFVVNNKTLDADGAFRVSNACRPQSA
jgi:hypothetical protein